MNAAAALALAIAIDRLWGEPSNRVHPVAWMGRLIAFGRDWALSGSRARQLWRGAVVGVAVPLGCAVLATVVTGAVALAPWGACIVTAVVLKPLFAMRALRDAAFEVRDALLEDDLDRARVALGSLCSRETRELDGAAVAAATVESLAENASDSVVAPFFYFGLTGLPGVAFYRASNTADAMIGYHGRFEWVGKVAARLDDVLNFVPARLTAILLLAVGPFAGGRVRCALRVLRRDRAKTESPNAGHPMAAMAGLLGVSLDKPGHYRLGDATRPIEIHDITRAWTLVMWASYSFAAVVAVALVVAERFYD